MFPLPTCLPCSSWKGTVNGVPLSCVNTTVPLAAGAPGAAVFVMATTVPQRVLPDNPSAICGKYKTDWAEQIAVNVNIQMNIPKTRFIAFLSVGNREKPCASV